MSAFTELVSTITMMGGIAGPLLIIEDSGNLTLSWTATQWADRTWDDQGALSYNDYYDLCVTNLDSLNVRYRDALTGLWDDAVGGL